MPEDKVSFEKTAIIGVGAVGGYLGGLLAANYEGVSFVARGERYKKLTKEGVHLIAEKPQIDSYIMPERCAEHLADLGCQQDLVILCIKEPSLEPLCVEIADYIQPGTAVLPIVNGVRGGEICRRLIPQANVIDSATYIVAHLEADGTVRQEGPYVHLHLGVNAGTDDQAMIARAVRAYLQGASIDCIFERKIGKAIWLKFCFNCAFNLLTTRYRTDVSGIISGDHLEEFERIACEVADLASAKGVRITTGALTRQTRGFLETMRPDATSSLFRDVQRDAYSNELYTFAGWPIEEAMRLGVEMPTLSACLEKIRLLTV